MSSVESLVESIRREGEDRARKIINDARAEAERIIKEAEERAKRIAEERASIEIETIKRRLLDARKRQLMMDKIKIKDANFKRLREILVAKIMDVVKGRDKRWDYTKILYSLIKEAVVQIGENEVIISANRRDLDFIKSHIEEIEERLRSDIGGSIKLRVGDVVDIIGGVICRSVAGDKVHNATIDGRIEEVIRRLSVKIYRRLGMMSQNKFRSMIIELLRTVEGEVTVRDATGRELVIEAAEDIEVMVGEDIRIDVVCKEKSGRIMAVYTTLGMATMDKLDRFLASVGKLEKDWGVRVEKLVFIAFSGAQDDVARRMVDQGVYLIMREQLARLADKIGVELF